MDNDLVALLAFEQRQQEELAALKVAENDALPIYKPSFIIRSDGVNKCDSPPPTSNGLILPPADCLARVETDEGVYFVCKQNLVIGRETGHSPADVSFKETFVSRAHLELFYSEDGWRFKCNGKNGIILNDILLNKGLGDTVLPPECKLKFPSTDIEFKFSSKFPVFLPTNLATYDNVYANSNSNHVKDGFSNSAIPPEPDHSNCVLRLPSPLTVDTGDKNEPRSDGCFEQDVEESSADSGENNFADNNDDREGKPPYSYAQLIVQAISSTPDRQLTLAGIYAYITKHYAYYRTCDKGWQNSIRHNLSLCRHFVRIPRSQDEPGKGSFWRIDPICEAKQIQQAFKKRRQGKGGSCSNAATSSASCIISASSSSNTSPPCYSFNENAKTRSGSAPASPTSAASPLPSGSLTAVKRGSLPAVGYLAQNRPLSDINSSMAEAFSPQSTSIYGGDSRRFSQTSSIITDESSAECVFIGQHRRSSPDEIKMAKTEHKSNDSPNRTGTVPTSLVLPVISEKTRNSILERHYQKGAAAANCNESNCQTTGSSPKNNNGPLTMCNEPSKIIADGPPRRNTVYSPQINGNGSRFISQSAPSSPKSFNKANIVEQETADNDSGRVHHHSGGTFSVRRNATDGRQRLQICYSRPWYVEVSTSDTSALEKLAQESRSRQNSGHHAQAAGAQGAASSLYRGSSGGGSKSLSTTPVRELLAAGAKTFARSIDAEGATVGGGAVLATSGAASITTSKPFALGVGGGLTSREYNNGKRLETLKQRSSVVGGGVGGAKLPHFTSSLVRNDAPKATTMVTSAHHKQQHQHLQQQPIPIAPASVANFLQHRSAPASSLDAAAALSLQAALTLGAQAAVNSSSNPYSAILNNASASLVTNLMAPILLQNYLPLVASTGLIGATGLLHPSQQQSNPNLMNTSNFPHTLSSLNSALNVLNGSTGGLLAAVAPISSNSHSLSTGSAFGLVGMGSNYPETSLHLNAAVVNSAMKRKFSGAEPPPLTKIIKRE